VPAPDWFPLRRNDHRWLKIHFEALLSSTLNIEQSERQPAVFEDTSELTRCEMRYRGVTGSCATVYFIVAAIFFSPVEGQYKLDKLDNQTRRRDPFQACLFGSETTCRNIRAATGVQGVIQIGGAALQPRFCYNPSLTPWQHHM
jgi:hypothetical protein